MHIAPLSPDDPAELGGYELLGRIGQGGMGQVYLGESPGGEPAAVKVIKPSVVDSETRLRFAQEVEILKTVWGARIAALLDADPEADPPWLATEYVEGLDLSRHVASHGPLDALLTASLGATLAEALATAHKQGPAAPRSQAGHRAPRPQRADRDLRADESDGGRDGIHAQPARHRLGGDPLRRPERLHRGAHRHDVPVQKGWNTSA
nr:protein kinase [Streptomyces sp. A244]